MRKLKFYSKKVIKYIFAFVVVIVLITLPALTFVKKQGEDSGLEVIDQQDYTPKLVTEITTVDSGVNEYGEYWEDLAIGFDEKEFKGYTPVDYVFVLTKGSTANGWTVSEDDPLYWAPAYSSMEEVEESLAYKKLSSNTVTVDAPPLATEDQIEEMQQQKIKEHILNNENHYEINNGGTFTRMYEKYGTRNVEVAVKFEKESPYDEPYTKYAEITNISLKVTNPNSSKANDGMLIDTPDITFATGKGEPQKITSEGPIGNKYDVITQFIYWGDPNGELSSYSGSTGDHGPSGPRAFSTVSLMTNLYAPRFRIVYEGTSDSGSDEILNKLDIFNVLPTISFTMYLSDNNNPTIDVINDIKIYDNEQIVLNEFGMNIDNSVMIADSIKLSDIPGVYDDTNTLAKKHIKFYATLDYEYKSKAEILEIYPNAIFNSTFPDDGKVGTDSIGSVDEPMQVQEDDLKIFQDIAMFDKTDFPEFVIYPNWDDAGRFNVVFATKDQYIFDSPEYSAEKMSEMKLTLPLVNDRTGQYIEPQVFLPRFDYIDYYGEKIYYAVQYPVATLFESETYYFSSTLAMTHKYGYTNKREMSANSFDNTKKDFSRDPGTRAIYYDEFTFTTFEELEYDENVDGLTIITSEQFHEANIHVAPDLKEIWLVVLVIFIIVVLLPFIIFIILAIRNRRIEHRLLN